MCMHALYICILDVVCVYSTSLWWNALCAISTYLADSTLLSSIDEVFGGRAKDETPVCIAVGTR